MVFFPGSTISNFDPNGARSFLISLRRLLAPGDFLLIGVDRIKDRETLEKAYNDSQGVTAAFNLNLLVRIQKELSTNLEPSTFSHFTTKNTRASKCISSLRIGGHSVSFRAGESIHTENSYKYSIQSFSKLVAPAGFKLQESFSDDQDYFTLYLCQVPRE